LRVGLGDRPALPDLLQLGVWKIELTPKDEPEPPRAEGEREPLPRSRPLLSAVLIVRDEERFLPQCLESLRDLADEIVIVDTGSSDRTPEIAEAAGAQVFRRHWEADFGAPRQFAIEQARGLWVLQIDADEMVRPFRRERLNELLLDPSVGGYYVGFRRREGLTRNWQLKLFHRHPGLRYRGVVHENLQPAELRETTGLKLRHCPLEIDHFGYEGDPRPKARRNLPLLKRRLGHEAAAGRDPAFLWLDLADSSRTLGEEAAFRDYLGRALRAARGAGWRHPSQAATWARAAELALEEEQSPDELLDEAEAVVPGDPYVAWLRARARLASGDLREALRIFAELAERQPPGAGWIGYDRRLFGPAPKAALQLLSPGG